MVESQRKFPTQLTFETTHKAPIFSTPTAPDDPNAVLIFSIELNLASTALYHKRAPQSMSDTCRVGGAAYGKQFSGQLDKQSLTNCQHHQSQTQQQPAAATITTETAASTTILAM